MGDARNHQKRSGAPAEGTAAPKAKSGPTINESSTRPAAAGRGSAGSGAPLTASPENASSGVPGPSSALIPAIQGASQGRRLIGPGLEWELVKFLAGRLDLKYKSTEGLVPSPGATDFLD